MNVNDPLAAAVIALAIVIVILLVFREVVCWYWKINRMVELLAQLRQAAWEHSYAATD